MAAGSSRSHKIIQLAHTVANTSANENELKTDLYHNEPFSDSGSEYDISCDTDSDEFEFVAKRSLKRKKKEKVILNKKKFVKKELEKPITTRQIPFLDRTNTEVLEVSITTTDILQEDGRQIQERSSAMGQVLCNEKCRLKCNDKFNDVDRNALFRDLLKTADEKNLYLFGCLKSFDVKRPNGKTHQVCKNALLKLLNIGIKKLDLIQNQISDGKCTPQKDCKGRHKSRPNKTPVPVSFTDTRILIDF
ncbi:hypothetical protein ABEB36_015667 [Hypothenemus hampei]|uniref:Uncharacterized protein n=1 Tax=Hypothenemus hampei TaxID=57062 RepID=A0ABD1DZZ0_HYPHA